MRFSAASAARDATLLISTTVCCRMWSQSPNRWLAACRSARRCAGMQNPPTKKRSKEKKPPRRGTGQSMRTREAVLPDAEQIHALISAYSGDGTLLPRTLAEICENVRDFIVLEDDGRIIG